MTDASETTPLKIELVPVKKQDVWKWPAALNLIFSGAGSGLYIVSYILRRAFPETFNMNVDSERNYFSYTHYHRVFICFGGSRPLNVHN